jgi:hypothetical protein
MFTLALPVLAIGLLPSTRGSIRGQALVVGALAYLTYNATLLVYATPGPCWHRAAGWRRVASPRSS